MKRKQTYQRVNTKIYTDVYSLFDLRLALIKELSPDAVLFEIENGYYNRKSFDTLTLSGDVIRKNVTKSLPNIPTDLFKQITKLLQRIKYQDVAELVDTVYSITINVHPFKISEEEKVVLARMFTGMLAMDAEIIIISKEPTVDVTHGFDYMFMYYGLRWLDKYIIKEKHSLISTTLVVPRLSETKHFELKDDVMNEIKVGLITYIDIDFIDVKYFSARRNNV